ncbi:TIGR00299 family protein [Sulfodiicoccus acidiphilus]|uniref:Putative nickel insertion protein n=1 Tax=Sulfodiicoccus acidiphilus TaxID=1670455 RepID=A0A348B6F2_9CREN|nr:nickel pincer cofactor biosynthesis protein LarC [Sulfodiicoccus acidiphilus]BBD73754.1 TIGR00299 family protein [Sulfodiicoccus acidiphilus]GGT98095.1 TIGR00299 family protein [Sulfodiicoccus acidiphilus]
MGRNLIVIDPSLAGASGDMFLGALSDLGAPQSIAQMVGDKISVEGGRNTKVLFKKVKKGEFLATKAEVFVERNEGPRTGNEMNELLRRVVLSLSLSERATKWSFKALNELLQVEGKLHGESVEEVDLHESGSLDTLIDIVGTSALLDSILGSEGEVICLPVALGGGHLTFSHGTVQVPAPATIEILKSRNAIVKGGPVEGELTTPTGASLLASLCENFTPFYPAMIPKAIGYGAGDKELPGVPNVLRLVWGEREGGLLEEEVVVLETDLDDCTGEELGYVLERLMTAGARDVAVIPETRKKGRPGHLLRVISDQLEFKRIAEMVLRETGTLGVRVLRTSRLVVPEREQVGVKVSVSGREFEVRVKVSKDFNGRTLRVKPEYEDVRKVASVTGLSIREVSELVLREFGES